MTKKAKKELIPFGFGDQLLRAFTDKNGEVWFVAKDIANILEYSETAMMTRRLDDDEVAKLESADLADSKNIHGGARNDFTIISESGLYNAIFGSQKPEAKDFKKWVTTEVLPSIRKTGGYGFGGLSADITKKIKLLIEQNEKNQAVLARVGALIEDPHEEAYRELEKWVKTHLAPTHDKRFGRVWVHNIYKEFTYNTKLRYKISEHDVMFKIALDHPEFELTTSRKEWFFIGCNQL